MLSRLIFAIPTICVIGFPAVAQPKPDCSKIEKKEDVRVQHSPCPGTVIR